MKQILRVGFFLFLAGTLVIPAGADNLAVGSGGQVLQLVSGVYGELFPHGTEADPRANVLALETLGGDKVTRMLVPSTSDLAVEQSPTLYHDPTTDVTYILWSARHNGVHPFLRLTQLSDGEWIEPFDITGSVFVGKNEPQLSVHHESWALEDGTQVERTVFHVLWWEELGGMVEKRVSALVSENGQLVGTTGILTLSNFLPPGTQSVLTGEGPLDTSVRLIGSSDGIVAGFLGGEFNQIEVLSSSVMPVPLSRLAFEIETAVLNYDSSGGMSLQEVVVETILESSSELHPAILAVMADSVLDLIDQATVDGGELVQSALAELADKMGVYLIEIGAKTKSGGLVGDEATVVTVRPESEQASQGAHHLAISHLATFDAPAELPQTAIEMFVSPRATAALLAWDDGDHVAYQETTADGWTDVSYLDTTKGIDRETAYEILEKRTLER